MRHSIREFATLLGVETTTVTNWRSGLSSVRPRSATQAILDTTYQQRASAEDRARFAQIVAEGEPAWRHRHPITRRLSGHGDGADAAPAPTGDVQHVEVAVTDAGISDELLTVLARIQRLSRSVDPAIIDQLHASTRLSIAQYETLNPANLIPALKKQRLWLDELTDQCSHPVQRRQLCRVASETSGLLGYIAVGHGNFSLARAYCTESYELGDHAEDDNLAAWARGMQSFCEYYAGDYDKSLQFAEDGLARADGGPQMARLAINGVARAKGKLGDTAGVHRAVGHAHELLEHYGAPAGVPSSIALESYSPAQVAGNAATAYLSLAMPDQVETYANHALAEMSETSSPWGRSLVKIDVARSHVLSKDADLDAAAEIMLGALDPSRGTPMIQVRRRGMEFVQDATARWGDTPALRDIRDMLVDSANPQDG
ncbi:hypothetical protein [Nocardia salmonicida]|uniref:hypothetical protein n=1 Tax=Nocardia salmonicida TaxID=53431 RepID=UPI0007A3A845|nr:hypothetical protein [Nocardia salmonicida]